jgi:Asp-tRNA(Asn)/Glu-tRNA(Gln) amidotransferase A subunit family amidase
MTIVDTRASSRSAKPATADALTELTAIDLITRYRIGNPSPADVIEAVLERIAQFEQRLNAFALLDADGARRERIGGALVPRSARRPRRRHPNEMMPIHLRVKTVRILAWPA